MEDSNIKSQSQDIDLKKLFLTFWSKKLLILSITASFGVGSIIYAITLPDIYTSSSLLEVKTQDQNNSSSNLASRYGGIASLAGLSLPSGTSDKSSYVIETIQSREFIKHLSQFELVIANLMAAKLFDKSTGKIIYDNSLYNQDKDEWTRITSNKKSQIPSYLEINEVYKELISIERDQESGFIKISFDHISPNFANSFLNLIISEFNIVAKERDLNDATNALYFLEERLSVTREKDIRDSINALISAQLQKIMYTNLGDEYLLRPIDKPFIPEIKSGPTRSLICISITFIGFIFSLIFVVIKNQYFNKE